MLSLLGCDRGFGQTLANKLALDGFRVYAGCLDVNSDGARQLQTLSKVKVVPVDVTNDKSVEGAVRVLNSELWDTGKFLNIFTAVSNVRFWECSYLCACLLRIYTIVLMYS